MVLGGALRQGGGVVRVDCTERNWVIIEGSEGMRRERERGEKQDGRRERREEQEKKGEEKRRQEKEEQSTEEEEEKGREMFANC